MPTYPPMEPGTSVPTARTSRTRWSSSRSSSPSTTCSRPLRPTSPASSDAPLGASPSAWPSPLRVDDRGGKGDGERKGDGHAEGDAPRGASELAGDVGRSGREHVVEGEDERDEDQRVREVRAVGTEVPGSIGGYVGIVAAGIALRCHERIHGVDEPCVPRGEEEAQGHDQAREFEEQERGEDAEGEPRLHDDPEDHEGDREDLSDGDDPGGVRREGAPEIGEPAVARDGPPAGGARPQGSDDE